MRRWLELAVTVPVEAADAVGARLLDWGAPGIVEEDAMPDRRLVVHLPETADATERRAALAAFLEEIEPWFPGSASAGIETRLVEEEDWAEGWRRGFPPIEVGRRLRIRPPWLEATADGRVEIVIEPAMAFGTGHHASTHGCLLALEELAEQGLRSPFLDLGTGSGILAFTAAAFGVEEIVALDVDPIAIDAARENARRMDGAARIRFAVGGVDGVPGAFATIVANLYSGVLATILPELARRLLPGGSIVVAGFLSADAGELVRRADEVGLVVVSERTIDGWTTLVFRSRDASPA
jgi:ribosomal protein L11 methyltransferase